MTPLTAVLDREARSLVQRLRLWTPARWAAAASAADRRSQPPAAPDPAAHAVPVTRGDLAHHLAQALADAAADLEGTARRALPRLDSDLALADQLAVTADDLVRADPPADVARSAVAHLLLHRKHLLDDDVPPGLAAALELDDVLATGEQACRPVR